MNQLKKQEAIKLAKDFLGGRSVLIVDPSANYRTSLKQFLSELNVKNVMTAANSTEAQRLLASVEIGLFVVEWILEGENGLEFIRAMQGAFDTSKVINILMTTENMKQDVILASEIGIDGYLLKPFSYESFVLKISELMKRALNPTKLQKNLKHAEILLLTEEYDEAEVVFEKALTQEANSARAMCGLAKIEMTRKKYESAIKLLKRAISYNRDYLTANRLLLQLYETQEDFEGMETQAKALHELSPENPQYTLILAQALLHRDQLEESENYFKKTIKLSPALSASYKGMGDISMKKNEHKKASKFYHKAFDLNKNDVSILNSLGMAYIRLENFKEGIHKYMMALSLSSDDERIFFNLGHAYEKQNQIKNAIENYERALTINPNFDKAKRGLERLQLTEKKKDK